jgi:organic radical activating enzyme
LSTYAIKEIFSTIQGEGARAGCRSVFLRFAGCNHWDGNPEHRERGKGACALWCDTDFVGGERLTAKEIIARLEALWPYQENDQARWVVLTGGEPGLQLDKALVDAFNDEGWYVAIETNGSVEMPREWFDWITISPKLQRDGDDDAWHMLECHELKVVVPGAVPGEPGWSDEALLRVAREFQPSEDLCFLQPQDPVDPTTIEVSHLKSQEGSSDVGMRERAGAIMPAANLEGQWRANVERCVEFVKAHPEWRLGLQLHKFLGLR